MRIYPEELGGLLPGKRGKALDDDEAVAALRAAQQATLDESFDALADGRYFDHWSTFLSALNEADVFLAWDGPADPPALDDGAVIGKARVADR